MATATKVTAAAHDPGAANAVAASVLRLRLEGVEVEAYAKGPAVQVFKRFAISPVGVASNEWNILEQTDCNVLLTGTSWAGSFECELFRWAKTKGIPSVAVLDYWSNYRQRFLHQEQLVLPDRVTALDEASVSDMLSAGLPATQIVVTGQPYFSWLIANRLNLSIAPGPVKKLLFVSQPGQNEVAALRLLLQALDVMPPLERFTIRFHPRQQTCAQSLKILEESGLPFSVDEENDPLSSVSRHDCVIGITTVLLVEAALIGVPAGSLVIGVKDTLKTNELGITKRLGSVEQICQFLSATESVSLDETFLSWHREADLRVAELVCSLAA